MRHNASLPLDRWKLAYRLADAHELTPPEAAVLMALMHFDGQGAGAWPGVDTLVRMTRFARRSVQRALRALEARGIVAGERRAGTSTRYRVRQSDAPTRATVTPHPRHSDARTVNGTMNPNQNEEVGDGRREPRRAYGRG